MSSDLIDLVQRLGRPRVLVVGDLMLDRYIWGNAARISQEAPVILLHADAREERLGGASSVATMLRALEAEVALVGVVGDDANGQQVRGLLGDLGVDQSAVLTDRGRPTTVKERYIGRAQQKHPQQMMRVDYESRDAVAPDLEQRLIERLWAHLSECDVVLISDYDKGVCTPGVIAAAVAEASRRGLKTLADPIRGGDYRKYRGCSSMTPNRLEASLASGLAIPSNDAALEAAERLRIALDLEASIITLDKDGMVLVDGAGARNVYPTRPRQVYDITGAGDMVLSVLGLALASGADYGSAIRLANIAGGLEVEKIGVATVTRDEILHDLTHADSSANGGLPSKLLPLPALQRVLEQQRKVGKRIVFTNGCFDVLHAGHVQYLHEARAQGDLLVVGLNSDASVAQLKGPTRPIHAAEARALVLAGLQAVDFITVFGELTPLDLIRAVRPDVLVKGADYRKEQVVGSEWVESYGGRVHLADVREGHSTTTILQRMQAA